MVWKKKFADPACSAVAVVVLVPVRLVVVQLFVVVPVVAVVCFCGVAR